MRQQVTETNYRFDRYVHLKRWISYWYQIREVTESGARAVLVVGAGDGIVVDVLKKLGLEVRTLDIAADLQPDYLGSVENAATLVGGMRFDAVLCCQVLEHLPFNRFESSIEQLSRITGRRLILSLPFSHKVLFQVSVRILDLKPLELMISLPRFYRTYQFNGQHYWEVGTKQRSLARIRSILEKHFRTYREFRMPEHPYYLYFILERRVVNPAAAERKSVE